LIVLGDQMKHKKDLYISAVIVAGGQGRRMNLDINKQYIEIIDKPILTWTLEVFEECDEVDEIVLVVNEVDIMLCKKNIIDKYQIEKVTAIVAGGKERQNSVYNGLISVNSKCDIVLVHDGARPFILEDSITAGIEAAIEFDASVTAVPVKDTIKISNKDGFVNDTLDRSVLWSAQTPQTFRLDIILEAYKKAFSEGFLGTDDSVLVERVGIVPKLVMGSYDNIKITTLEDLAIAEAIISQRYGL